MSDLPRLNRRLLESRSAEDATLDLPEKVVQFGTGAFLRGFIEYFIDTANHAGTFGGRIVAVGSTGSGRDRKLNEQNGLYTIAERGIEAGHPRNEYRLITSVSRALSASLEWQAVLACARNADIELVCSNTTEIGIQLDDTDRLGPGVPKTFPGKLTSFLLERARHFDYARERGLVVLPCELIEDNGDRLKQIVLALADRWSLGLEFAQWLEDAVPFCNTLVDRIVPGEPDAAQLEMAWQELGYRDDLLTVCEPYRLFAIETNARTADRLAFSRADPNIFIAEDITPYRERKVRLLNGMHTIIVPLALLSGCKAVAEAMRDNQLGAFARRVLFTELVPSTAAEGADVFAHQVIDRFSNPYVRHALLDITLQQTTKMRVRIVPAIVDFAARTGTAPDSIALGFAAYLLYVREAHGNGRADDQADTIRGLWRAAGDNAHEVAALVCNDRALWHEPLNRVPGFANRVGDHLEIMVRAGVRAALDQHLAVAQGA
jgi:tagaturonate reductase